MKELLEYIIKSIAAKPKAVEITKDENNRFQIKLAEEDIGTVIGSGGKTIRSIKTLLSLKSRGDQFSIEILEN